MSENLSLRYDPRLIEEAVFFAQRNAQAAGDLGRQRNQIYEISDPEERERLFRKLYADWFVRLGLEQPIEQAFGEQPLILSEVKACLIGRATKAADEGAELFVPRDEDSHGAPQRTVRLLLRPETLLSRESLLTLLRHELFHITDMLDPAFAYEPALPASEVGPTYDLLLRDRYRTLWDTTINGRMVRRGWLPRSARSQCLSDFAASFPMLADQLENAFARFFDQEPHTHLQLLTFSQDPRTAFGKAAAGPQAGSRCALCGFPTYNFAPHPELLDSVTTAEIVTDFPQWHPADGLCTQCADLYRARRVSLEAAKRLPGWHHSSSKSPCFSR